MITDQYFAGLFDGEGCISLNIQKSRAAFNAPPRLYIGLTNMAAPLLMEISAKYNGNLRYRPKANMVYIQWASASVIETVLIKIEPYLIVKREQALLVLWWINNTYYRDRRCGIFDATQIMIDDLKAMKKNMLLTADSSIARIQACFTVSNVVSIR